MIRQLLIVAALTAAAGCDDPAVRDRIDSVLDHGAVLAHMRCEVAPSTHVNCPLGYGAKIDLLQDGSSIVWGYASDGSSFTNFNVRGSTAAACKKNWALSPYSDGTCVWAVGGDFSWYSAPSTQCDDDIDTVCVGFNLEAFD